MRSKNYLGTKWESWQSAENHDNVFLLKLFKAHVLLTSGTNNEREGWKVVSSVLWDVKQYFLFAFSRSDINITKNALMSFGIVHYIFVYNFWTVKFWRIIHLTLDLHDSRFSTETILFKWITFTPKCSLVRYLSFLWLIYKHTLEEKKLYHLQKSIKILTMNTIFNLDMRFL